MQASGMGTAAKTVYVGDCKVGAIEAITGWYDASRAPEPARVDRFRVFGGARRHEFFLCTLIETFDDDD